MPYCIADIIDAKNAPVLCNRKDWSVRPYKIASIIKGLSVEAPLIASNVESSIVITAEVVGAQIRLISIHDS